MMQAVVRNTDQGDCSEPSCEAPAAWLIIATRELDSYACHAHLAQVLLAVITAKRLPSQRTDCKAMAPG